MREDRATYLWKLMAMVGRYGSLSPKDALEMPLTYLEAYAEQVAAIVEEENRRSTSAPDP